MRVLLVAPADPGINSIPELRNISALHDTTVLNNGVSQADLFDACRNSEFDVIHFMVHSDCNGILLTDGRLTPHDVLRVAQMAQARCVFLNGCDSGTISSYIVRHGVPCAIRLNQRLLDTEAWKVPLAFYTALADGLDYVAAFVRSDDGDGLYGYDVDPAAYVQLVGKEARMTRVAHFAVAAMVVASMSMLLSLAALLR